MGKLQVVVGGQFGSCGKGAIAAYLGKESGDNLAAVRVAGPNAGHSAVDAQGRKWALRQIPVVAVTNLKCQLVIAAGSEIEIAVLEQETNELEAAGIPIRERLLIDGQATILTDEHKAAEGGNDGPLQKRIGSTGKGVGSCRADRIMRSAGVWNNDLDTSKWLNNWMEDGGDVMIEGTQGFGLGLHAGWYPHCTSSDCRAIDFLAMAGVSPWSSWADDFEVWVVLRTYPIRVAGNSGPLKNELTWDELARRTSGYIQPEKTTVTKKVRRIGEWDPELAANAVAANGGPGAVQLALTFADYVDPTMTGANSADKVTARVAEFMDTVEKQTGAFIQLLGTGPDTVVDFR